MKTSGGKSSRRTIAIVVIGVVMTLLPRAHASILGSVHGLIHEPQHRPVSGATVKLRAVDSAFEQTLNSTDAGEFLFEKIPLGQYMVEVQLAGFRQEEQRVTI